MSGAVKPAYQGELMLAGWTQNHTSGAKVSFWLPDDESLEAFRHMTTRRGNTAGQRFMAVLVMLGDDEQPLDPTEDGLRPGLSRSAALLCKSPVFQAYVGAVEGWLSQEGEPREEQAATYVRTYCMIESRSALDSSPTAARLYQRMLSEFSDWSRATGAAGSGHGASYARRDS